MPRDELNELTISGYVEHEPVIHDQDGGSCCELVLTHGIYSEHYDRWLLGFFSVRVWGQLGEQVALEWEPRQIIVVTGHLDYEQHDTLAGPMAKITILATNILTTGLHQTTDEPGGYELQDTPGGAVWRIPANTEQ
jgi:hypothetical protein